MAGPGILWRFDILKWALSVAIYYEPDKSAGGME
jgi:hypothetical protein